MSTCNKKMQWMVLSTAWLMALPAWANFTGEAYDMDSNRSKILYKINGEETTDQNGVLHSRDVYSNMSGEIVTEQISDSKGLDLYKFSYEDKLMKEVQTVQVKDGQVFYNITRDGKALPQKVEKLRTDRRWVIDPTLDAYMKEVFPALMAGKTVVFDLAVPDRQESIAFNFEKVGEETVQGQKVIVVKMKVDNFLLRLLVSPSIFKYTMEGQNLLEYKGRVAQKLKDGNGWKDFDAELVFRYK